MKLEDFKTTHEDAIQKNVISKYVDVLVTQKLAKQIRDEVQKYIIEQLCYAGLVANIKIQAGVDKKIKSVDLTFSGLPVHDPLLPALIKQSYDEGCRLKARIELTGGGEPYISYENVALKPILSNQGATFGNMIDLRTRKAYRLEDEAENRTLRNVLKSAMAAVSGRPSFYRNPIKFIQWKWNSLITRLRIHWQQVRKERAEFLKKKMYRDMSYVCQWEQLCFDEAQIKAHAEARKKKTDEERTKWFEEKTPFGIFCLWNYK